MRLILAAALLLSGCGLLKPHNHYEWTGQEWVQCPWGEYVWTGEEMRYDG